MNQNKKSNEKVIKKSDKNDNIKDKNNKTNYDIPKAGDPNFSCHHHTIEGRKVLDDLDSFFGI